MSERETVHVPLDGRTYDIIIGDGLLDEAGAMLAARFPGRRFVYVLVLGGVLQTILCLQTMRRSRAAWASPRSRRRKSMRSCCPYRSPSKSSR